MQYPRTFERETYFWVKLFSCGGVVLGTRLIARVQNNSYKSLGIDCASDGKIKTFRLLHYPEFPPLNPTVYTPLVVNLTHTAFCPTGSSQLWGEPELQSPHDIKGVASSVLRIP